MESGVKKLWLKVFSGFFKLYYCIQKRMSLLGFYHNVVPSEAVLLVNRLYLVKNSVSLESRHVLPDGKLDVDSLRIRLWKTLDKRGETAHNSFQNDTSLIHTTLLIPLTSKKSSLKQISASKMYCVNKSYLR